ncbi:2TM domain-containing protein [Psychroserpens sp. XS_ASV72]|uniref:2TM domain-containing protein n=1 Tax=Psychroserpens sp. XS_ASV72 TaxID=3241293 RepID=UPI003517072D
MEFNESEKQKYLAAKKKVKRLQTFYLHLMLYVIAMALLAYNFYIMTGPYQSEITALNIAIMVLWTLFIIIHAWSVYKGKLFFSKRWEDKKIESILKEKNEETTFWE